MKPGSDISASISTLAKSLFSTKTKQCAVAERQVATNEDLIKLNALKEI